MKWRAEDGSPRQRSCEGRTQRQQEAERQELEEELNNRAKDVTWFDLWDQFKQLHLADLSKKHAAKCVTMQRRLTEAAERLGIKRLKCSDINARLLLEVEAELLRIGNERSTVKSNLDTLWSIIAWGQSVDLIPDIARPKRKRGKRQKQSTNRKSKGRSLATEEIERLQAAIPLVCKRDEDPAGFIRATDAMRFIGMRLTEAWYFSWEPGEGRHYPVLLDTDKAAIQFDEMQKSGVEEKVPLTRQARDWLRSLDPEETGPWICRTKGKRGYHQTENRLGRVISDAGRKALIVVKRISTTKIKYASAHDLRRTFVADLHQYLNLSELQRMSRHSDAQVLLDFYADSSTPTLMLKLAEIGSGGFSGGSPRTIISKTT